MTRRNPPRRPRLRLVGGAGKLEALAQRIEPADLEGIIQKMKLVTALGRLRLREVEAEIANPSRPPRV